VGLRCATRRGSLISHQKTSLGAEEGDSRLFESLKGKKGFRLWKEKRLAKHKSLSQEWGDFSSPKGRWRGG